MPGIVFFFFCGGGAGGGGGWLKQGLFGSWHSGFVVVIYSPTKADKPIPTS